jgi:hypothetical protein
LSTLRKKQWEDPQYQAERAEVMARTWSEKKEELSRKMKNAWATEETQQRHREGITDESRKKMSEGSRKRAIENSRPILQLTLEGELVKEWPSPMPAIREYGQHVSSVLSGKRKNCGGFFWKYLS